MTNTNSRGLLRGTSWNLNTFEGNDPPYELSPQHFSELAAELRLAEVQQQRRASDPNFNPISTAAASARNNGLALPQSAITTAPTNLNLYPPPPAPQQGTDHGSDQAATHISRLYNHMLMQLPTAVQQRAQQHLIMRTANVSKSGVPVQQATMLVQQELLPLMQQAFMRLQQAGAIGNTTTTTNPATIGANVGVQGTTNNHLMNSGHAAGLGAGAGGSVGAAGGLTASGMTSFAVGKAAAAPAIAATEAVIQQHQQQRARQMQANNALIQQQQQQQADHQQRQNILLQQHQKLKQLQALQAMHLQQQQQQQQQAAGGSLSALANGILASAAANGAAATGAPINAGYRTTSPTTTEGPAQALRNSIASDPTIAVPAPAPASAPALVTVHNRINITTTTTNPNNSNIDRNNHQHQQPQKRQRMTSTTNAINVMNANSTISTIDNTINHNKNSTISTIDNRNHLVDQWSDFFGNSTHTIINQHNNNRIHIVTAAGNGDGGNGNGNGGVYDPPTLFAPPMTATNTTIPDMVDPALNSYFGMPPPPLNNNNTTMPTHQQTNYNNNNIGNGIYANGTLHGHIHTNGYVLDTTNHTNAFTSTTTNTYNSNALGLGAGVDGVGVVALSRGKAASAKMQAKEATQRYAWTAGMLNEVFSATPVDETGLLKQEQKNASAGGGGGGGGGAAFGAYIVGENDEFYVPALPSSLVGTEGQKMLVAAAQRIHQGVVLKSNNNDGATPLNLNNSGTGDGDGTGAPKLNIASDEAEPGLAIYSNDMNKVDSDSPLVPVSLTVTKLQVPTTAATSEQNAAAGTGTGAGKHVARGFQDQGQMCSGVVTEAELLALESELPLQLGNTLMSSK